MASIFLGTEVEPSAFEIAMQQIYLSGLQKRVAETGNLSSAVEATLGFKRDAGGKLVELTEQERFDSLDPVAQSTYNLFKQQVTQLESAFEGEPSEKLKQRSVDQFKVLKEELARRGQPLAGSSLETGVGFSTPAIQSLGERQRTQGLLEGEERRGEIDRGFSNIFQAGGLLSGFQSKTLANLINAPKRFDVGGGGGLLEGSQATSLFNAQSQADALSGIGGFFGDIAKEGAGLLLKKYI